jgi:hypothetical protein
VALSKQGPEFNPQYQKQIKNHNNKKLGLNYAANGKIICDIILFQRSLKYAFLFCVLIGRYVSECISLI